jgi:hypothetical protein
MPLCVAQTGGAIYANKGTLTIGDSVFAFNQAVRHHITLQ